MKFVNLGLQQQTNSYAPVSGVTTGVVPGELQCSVATFLFCPQ